MDVDDVVLAVPKHAPHVAPKMPAKGDARLGAVGVHRLASADADDVRLLLGARDVRRDHIDVVATPAGFTGKKMDVLADAAEVRIVILRHQRDTQ
jgi:hypothetical protein